MLTIAIALMFMAGGTLTYTYAEDAACVAKAQGKDGKPLVGAAKTSFMKKCVSDACEASAKEKKLAGAAKTSHLKKCVEDGMKS
jgi:hypothetical protein